MNWFFNIWMSCWKRKNSQNDKSKLVLKSTRDNCGIKFYGMPSQLMKTNKIFLIFFILLSLASYSQKDLVPNGSFEKFKNKSTLINNALPWKNYNSVDYYKTPMKYDTSKYKGAHSGIAYVGLRFQRDYRELPYVKLTQPLKANTSYRFQTYIRLAYWSNVSLKSFGAVFTKGIYNIRDKVDSTTSIIIYNRKGLHDKDKWIQISGYYMAKGGEKYITLGNYVPKVKKDFIRLKPFKIEFMKSEAYYFMDDVSLVEGKDTSAMAHESSIILEDTIFKPGRAFELNINVVLNNVFFESGQTELMLESLPQLDNFVKYLDDHPDAEVLINGYTDALTKRGKKISKMRAGIICEYLVSKDVLNKMYFKGFGGAFPLADDTTEEGRNKNNRIEFVIIKQ